MADTVCNCASECARERSEGLAATSDRQFGLLESYLEAVMQLAVDMQHRIFDHFRIPVPQFEKNVSQVLRRIPLRISLGRR